MEVVQRYTRSVTFQDSLKFYEAVGVREASLGTFNGSQLAVSRSVLAYP